MESGIGVREEETEGITNMQVVGLIDCWND